MTEPIAWLIVLGLAVALVGIYSLYRQLREHRRDTAEIMLQSNELMLAELKRLSDPSVESASSAAVNVMLERRGSDRRHHTADVIPWPSDRRKSPGRRAQDLRRAS